MNTEQVSGCRWQESENYRTVADSSAKFVSLPVTSCKRHNGAPAIGFTLLLDAGQISNFRPESPEKREIKISPAKS
jgi:hypothetical protein